MVVLSTIQPQTAQPTFAVAWAFFPVRCPLPMLTPLNAIVSLPFPVGFGFELKLNLMFFQVSPRFACKPSDAVGS
jgi:hypothetical protein